MKKLLLTTALLGASAGMAMADVTISGTGRFGLVYNPAGTAADALAVPPVLDTENTQVSGRLRFNIDASVETDSGATFGGRIRLQHSIGSTGAGLSAALLYVEYEGLRVEVGNSNTAYDSAALLYASEIGFIGSSGGNSRADIFSFSSGAYSAAEANRVGLYASYSVSGFTGQFSYVNPDQALLGGVVAPADEELSIALAYETDQFTVSLAAVQNGGGTTDNDEFFLGGRYNVSEDIKVGLNYIDNKDGVVIGDTIVLYGEYTFGATTVHGYVANNDADNNEGDTTYGIGAAYDLGGATLNASIQRQNYGNVAAPVAGSPASVQETYADLGVNFSF